MLINGLDHVNIITNDLDGTAAFYEDVLGLHRTATPVANFKGAWLSDADGNAIVHLIWKDPAGNFGAEHVPGSVTGAFHHVAFRCRGYDGTIERLKAAGLQYFTNEIRHIGVRQIFLRDPNAINIELNFADE